MISDTAAIIAALNEERYIGSVIDKIKKYINTIIVVDDGSTDRTSSIAKEKGAIVLRHVINLGKGAATRTGCDYALKIGMKNIILIDADGQHDPNEIPKFMNALENNDIIFGYRTFNKDMPFIFKLGNTIINSATKALYRISLKDTQSGYRAMTADTYARIRWQSSDYSMESEMIANLGKTQLKYTEIPIPTIYSEAYKGTTVLDGVKIVANMMLWRFK